MPRPYEIVLIFDSALEEGEVEDKLQRFKHALTGGDGDRVAVTHWGKRKLAYPIEKKEQGIYVLLTLETEPDLLSEFERIAKIDEQLLRHLTIVDPIEAATTPAIESPSAEAEEE